MWGSGMNLITTVIGFGMSAAFIVFICTRIICRRIRGVESRPVFEIESGIDLEQNNFYFAGSQRQGIGLMALNPCLPLQSPL